MKKLLLCLPILTALLAHTQKGTWSFSVGGGFGWGGPKTTFKKAMVETNFDQTQSGWLGKSKFPQVYPAFHVSAKVGKGVKENTAFFVAAGVTSGSVEGYNGTYYDRDRLLFSNGARVSVVYKVMQLTTGLQHTLHHSKVTFGYGPSVYVLNYKNAKFDSEQYQSVVPGIHLSGAIPLFRKGGKLGVALVTDLNLALPAQLKPLHHHYTEDGTAAQVAFMRKKEAGMTQGTIGLALMFRS